MRFRRIDGRRRERGATRYAVALGERGRIQQPARAVEVSGLGSVSSAPRGANPAGTGVMSAQPYSGQELVDV